MWSVVEFALGPREQDELDDKPPSPPDNHSASAPDNSERHTPRRRSSCIWGNIRSVSATENRIRTRAPPLPLSSSRSKIAPPKKPRKTHPVSGGRYRLGRSSGTHEHPSSVVSRLNGETSVNGGLGLPLYVRF